MTLYELHKRFNTQLKCLAYLEKIRWGKKVRCVFCNSDHLTKRKGSMKWHCNSCNKDFSVLYETIFENTRLPLPKFFEIMLFINNSKLGISAMEIVRNTGVSYKTAWLTAMRTRCTMIDNELRLEGLVEFDESYFRSKDKEKKQPENTPNLSKVEIKRGRGSQRNVPVIGAVEKKGQVYVKIVERVTSKNLLALLKKFVNTKESIVFTDEFKSYNAFDKVVDRVTIKHKETYGKGIKTINTIEGFWSILKNGIKGNFRAISKKYLPFYLAEYSYKYNHRNLRSDAFEHLLKTAVQDEKLLLNYKPIKKDVKRLVYSK